MTAATSNGKPHKRERPSVEDMKAQARELRIANRWYREKLQADVLEGLYDYYSASVYGGGTDLYQTQWTGLNQATGGASPTAQPSDRSGGRQWPIWTTDTQVNQFIQASRILVAYNDYAKGCLANLVNAIIGKHFTYKVGARDTPEVKKFNEQGGAKPDDPDADPFAETPMDVLCRGVESFLKRIFARSNWTITNLPEEVGDDGATLSGGGTKEREACWRTWRDGNGFIRLFFNGDGTTDIRFVDPECVWGQPAGTTADDGWTYGIQNKVYRVFNEDTGRDEVHHDREQVVAYFVRPSEPDESGNTNLGGEVVPAAEMIHIKIPGTDCEIKKGIPLFWGDMLAALLRASNLQRVLSQSAAVRAATAEVWKHQIGTQNQISSLQNPGTQTVYPAITAGDPTNVFPTLGGRVRRIPYSQEPVDFPTTTNVPEHQMAAQGDLRQAGCSISAPEYLMSGDASSANFSSLQEAGTPWVTARESDQEHFISGYIRVCWRIIRHAVKCEKLPEAALALCELTIKGPLVHKDNKGEMAQVSAAELRAGITSPQEEIGKRGADPRKIAKDLQEWKRLTGGAQEQEGGDMGDDEGPQVDPQRSQRAKEAAMRRGLNVGESRESQWLELPDDFFQVS